MHSTVQTGLFSQSLLNNDSGAGYHNYSSVPTRYGHSPKHRPNLYTKAAQNKNDKHYHIGTYTGHHAHHGSSSSTNVSLNAINQIDEAINTNNADALHRARLNLSSSNIAKLPAFVFMSNSNLDKISSNKNLDQANTVGLITIKKSNTTDTSMGGVAGVGARDVSSSSSSSIIGRIVSTNNLTRNLSTSNFNNDYCNASHLNACGASNVLKMSNSNLNNAMPYNNNNNCTSNCRSNCSQFCNCTKPCGLLTTILGVLLLTSCIVGFLFLFHGDLCAYAVTCSHPLLKLYTISALVCGIVLVFIGLVIVVYTKKDVKVIVTSAKNFDKIVHYKDQPQSNAKHYHLSVQLPPPASNLDQPKDQPSSANNSTSNKLNLISNSNTCSAEPDSTKLPLLSKTSDDNTAQLNV